MLFDPIRQREIASGALNMLFNYPVKEDSPVGNYGDSHLRQVLYLWLSGFDKEAALIIPRSLQWLNAAIASKEEDWFGGGFPDAHRTTLHWAKAIGEWMLHARNDKDSFTVAMQSKDGYLQRGGVKVLGPDTLVYTLQKFVQHEQRGIPIPPTQVLRDGSLDDYMMFAFQAEQFEAGIAKFESYCAAKAPSLKKILKPREFGYALCLHHVRGQFNAADLFAAGRKMLQAQLEENWLGRGQAMRAATWLKIVYWHANPSLTPLQTVLKAYNNMPNVPTPEFVTVLPD